MAEVQRLEGWVARLFEMGVAAGDHVVEHGLFDRMRIPPIARPEVRRTWEAEPPSVYGRFDLRYDGQGPPKLLEFNADTPTRSEEHTSELQSRQYLVCRLLLEKKKKTILHTC